MDPQRSLQSNLARFRRRFAQVARQIEAADLKDIEMITGPRGEKTLLERGVQLASAYDPKREGEKLAEEMAREPADLLIAVGFGLGYHLEAYRQKLACPILIYEPSLSRLRAALSLRPGFSLLGHRDVHLATTSDALRAQFHKLYVPGIRTRLFVHPALMRLDGEAVYEAARTISRAKDSYDITAVTNVKLYSLWARSTIQNLPQLLKSPPADRLFGRYKGLPAVVAAAGPSLNKQLPLLREMREKVLVIAIGQCLGALRAAGIEPDFVHIVESQNVAHQLEKAGGGEGVNFVPMASCHPTVFEIPVATRFIVYPQLNAIANWLAGALDFVPHTIGGGTVAQSAVFLAHAMGGNPIILIGQDLAFTGGKIYAQDSLYEEVGFEQTEGNKYVLTKHETKAALFGRTIDQKDRRRSRPLVWVEGWDGERVPTSVSYATFIEQYREIGRYMRSRDVLLLNCTEGGARIPELEHCAFREALAQCTSDVACEKPDLQAISNEWHVESTETLERKLEADRKALAELVQECEQGSEQTEQVERALARARSKQHKIDLLARLGRAEKRVRKCLAEIPWIDTVIQRELHRYAAEVRSIDVPGESPQRAIEEARCLFEAVLAGSDRVGELMDQLARRIDEYKEELRKSLEDAGGGNAGNSQ